MLCHLAQTLGCSPQHSLPSQRRCASYYLAAARLAPMNWPKGRIARARLNGGR